MYAPLSFSLTFLTLCTLHVHCLFFLSLSHSISSSAAPPSIPALRVSLCIWSSLVLCPTCHVFFFVFLTLSLPLESSSFFLVCVISFTLTLLLSILIRFTDSFSVSFAFVSLGMSVLSLAFQPLAAGSYCVLGAASPAPTDGVTGNLCDAGAYCPASSALPVPCPVATYNPVRGKATIASCLPCAPGAYCAGIGVANATGACMAGYYCSGNATVPNPQDGITGAECPIAAYCPVGAAAPTLCAAGSFQNRTAQATCIQVPAGYYSAQGASAPSVCPTGSFCIAGSGLAYSPCPSGTFGNASGMRAAADCLACTPGSFCGTSGLTAPSGECTAGYYCAGAASAATQIACPAGSFCGVGSSIPTPCAPGTFSNTTRLTSGAACLPCTSGSYCATAGLSAVTGACAAGFACTGGASSAQPTNGTAQGGYQCGLGTYCTAGSAAPKSCVAGTYADRVGLSVCSACLASYYCPAGASTYTPCPFGSYCPASASVPTACPIAKYSNATGLSASTQCLTCLGMAGWGRFLIRVFQLEFLIMIDFYSGVSFTFSLVPFRTRSRFLPPVSQPARTAPRPASRRRPASARQDITARAGPRSQRRRRARLVPYALHSA